MKKLTEKAWKLSPEERIEFLRVLSAMVGEDGYDGDAVATIWAAKPGVPGWEVTASYTASA